MRKNKKVTVKTVLFSTVGVVGTVLWQKKDLVKAFVQLRKYPEGWVEIQRTPEVFLTKINERSKENLFEYLAQSPWRLVDQVADGYFWMNSKEEILLLTQKKMMQDYWLWTASRPFFQKSETNEAPKTTEECETTQEEA